MIPNKQNKKTPLFFLGFVIYLMLLPGTWISPNTLSAEENVPTEAVQKAVTEAAEKATEKTIEKAVEKAAEKAAEKATEKTVEKAVEKAVEKVSEMAAEKAMDKAAAEAMEKVAEKAVETADEQAELTARRPDEWRGMTKVNFLIFVVDIDEIDDAAQNFTANVYIRLRWQDKRLAKPEGSIRQIHLEEVWNPRVLIANRQGIVSRSLPEVVQVDPDGTVIYHQRYTGKFSQPLRLEDFPIDKHKFTIHFAATGYSADELEFIPDVSMQGITGGGIADVLSLPDWRLLKHETIALAYTPIPEIRTAGFAFRFEAERYVAYYIWQVILPLAVVVIMSWAGFWIGQEHVGVRIGVATSSILTLIAHRFVLASLLPRLPYMTRLDYFSVGSTVFVFSALIVVVATSVLFERKGCAVYAKNINLAARLGFPTVFLILLVWFGYS